MRVIAVVAFTAGVLASALVYYYSRRKTKIERRKVLKVLQEVTLESSPHLISLANFCRELKKQAGAGILDEEIESVALQHSRLPDHINALQKKVYERHGVTETQLKEACENEYANDEQVQGIVGRIRANHENAFRGVLPTIDVTLPETITPSFTLSLLEQARNADVKIASCLMRSIIEAKIKPNASNPKFIEAIQRLESEFDQANEMIFHDHCLDQYEVPAVLLFNIALQKFSKEDAVFARKVEEIEADFKLQMHMIFSNSLTLPSV